MNEVIFSYPTCDKLADRVSDDTQIPVWKINFSQFKDGWPNIFIEDVEKSVSNKTVFYISDISTPAKFFENIAVIQALVDYYAAKVHVIVPYFPVGTMERIDEEWQVATAKTMARILSSTPAWENGKTSFHVFDLHDLRERFYTEWTVSLRLHSAMDLIKNRVADIENLSVAFPDEWAEKRFKKDFKWYSKIICTKVREWDKRVISIKEWNVKWRNVLLIDDLIQTWGTLREAAIKLRDAWATRVFAHATHGIFPNDSQDKLSEYLDWLTVTNSIPENEDRFQNNPKIEVLDIKQIIIDKVIRAVV